MRCCVRARYLHTVCFYRNSMLSYLLKHSFCLSFSHWIFSDLSSGYADFSSIFYICFWAHWLADMRQTQVNFWNYSLILSFAQLPMLNSDRLHCFCPLLNLSILDSCSDPLICTQEAAACVEEFRATHLRCVLDCRNNDITVLIVGNPKTPYMRVPCVSCKKSLNSSFVAFACHLHTELLGFSYTMHFALRLCFLCFLCFLCNQLIGNSKEECTLLNQIPYV